MIFLNSKDNVIRAIFPITCCYCMFLFFFTSQKPTWPSASLGVYVYTVLAVCGNDHQAQK